MLGKIIFSLVTLACMIKAEPCSGPNEPKTIIFLDKERNVIREITFDDAGNPVHVVEYPREKDPAERKMKNKQQAVRSTRTVRSVIDTTRAIGIVETIMDILKVVESGCKFVESIFRIFKHRGRSMKEETGVVKSLKDFLNSIISAIKNFFQRIINVLDKMGNRLEKIYKCTLNTSSWQSLMEASSTMNNSPSPFSTSS